MKITSIFTLFCVLMLNLGCASQQAPAPSTDKTAGQPHHTYSYQEGDNDKSYIRHTLYLVGDSPSGVAKYAAAKYQNGERHSLVTSATGTYSIVNNQITIKAGPVNSTGTIQTNQHIMISGTRYKYTMTLQIKPISQQ